MTTDVLAPTAAAAPAYPSASGRNPIEEFREAVENRKASGDPVFSLVGWALYFIVLFDAALNARGSGSLTMLVVGGIGGRGGEINPRATGFSILIAFIQSVLLVLSGLALMKSPWGRWLRAALRQHRPGVWIARFWVELLRGDLADALVSLDFKAAAIESAIFLVSFIVLSPSIGLVAIDPLHALLGLTLVLLICYGVTAIALATAATARRDTASAAGILLGCALPFAFAAYAYPVSDVLHTTADGYAEFTIYELIVLAVAAPALLLWQFGSMTDDETVNLDLGAGNTGVLSELPIAAGSAFMPFQFRVLAHGKKIVLLSRPAEDAIDYTVHTSLEKCNLTKGHWTLLNLSELDQSIGNGGQINLVKKGHSGYLECHVDLHLTTITPEALLGKYRGKRVHIAIDEFHNLHQRLLSGLSVGDHLRQELDSIIGNELDAAIDTEAGDGQLATMNSILAGMRTDVSNLKQALDIRVAMFRAGLTGLRINREEEIRGRVLEAFGIVLPLLNEVRDDYRRLQSLDQNRTTVQQKLEPILRNRVELALHRFATSHTAIAPGEESEIGVLDLISLQVQPPKINLSAEADVLHKRIDELYGEAEASVSRAAQEMGAYAGEHGKAAGERWKELLDPRRSAAVARAGVEMLGMNPASPAKAKPEQGTLGPQGSGSEASETQAASDESQAGTAVPDPPGAESGPTDPPATNATIAPDDDTPFRD